VSTSCFDANEEKQRFSHLDGDATELNGDKMARENKSIFRTFMFHMLAISCFSVVVAGYFWISQEYASFHAESKELRENYLESQRDMIRNEVQKVVDYVDYMRSLREKRLKDSIRERVYEAYAIANNIYRENRGKKSNAEIADMIRDALRPIRFSGGKGYYFATNLKGIEMLFADRPTLEGSNMINFRDTQGKYIIRDMIEICRSSKEGFYQYTWTKPNSPGSNFPKIAYVKLFEPLDWFIGTGEYLDTVEEDIKREILDRIAKIRFGRDGYIFVVSYAGVTLMNDVQRDRIGFNSWELTDPNGIKVIQEERRAVTKPGGDFIRYTWKKPTTGKMTQKLSFVKGVADWQWMIGAGVYIDEAEAMIAQKRNALTARVWNGIFNVAVLMTLLFLFFYFIARRYSENVRKSFDIFSVFFENAATNAVRIDPDRLPFMEFKSLAISANHMVDNRNRAEYASVESEKQYRRLFEQSYDAIFIHDLAGAIRDINESALKTLGYDRTEILSKNMRELYTPEEMTSFDRSLQIVQEEGSCRFESFLRRKNGGVIDADISMRMIDQPKGIVQLIRDVTEQRQMEEQLRIRERMDSLGALAGGIAHDFNNLLVGIMGNLDLLRFSGCNLTDNMRSYIDGAFQSCERSATLMKNIQSLSTGAVSCDTSIDLHSIAREVFSILERTTDKLIEKKIDFETDRFFVYGKSDQIHQVFMNLGANAVQAIEEKGVAPGDFIRLTAEEYTIQPGDSSSLPPGEYVKIEFQDTGTGMTEEVKSRAFDPLFSTKRRGSHKGQGLGLAMVYNIVTRNHTGRIEIDTREGAGTTFRMYLPKALPVARAPLTDEEAPLWGNETILVIEDEEGVRNVVEKILQAYGYTPRSAPDGPAGLTLYAENKYSISLVLLDLTMPKMSGITVLDELKKMNPSVKVLISSGHSEDEVKNLTGIAGYVTKPYKASDILKTIRAILDTS
jgi:PAS domain S-box-containing protein